MDSCSEREGRGGPEVTFYAVVSLLALRSLCHLPREGATALGAGPVPAAPPHAACGRRPVARGGNRVGARRRWKRPFEFPILQIAKPIFSIRGRRNCWGWCQTKKNRWRSKHA